MLTQILISWINTVVSLTGRYLIDPTSRTITPVGADGKKGTPVTLPSGKSLCGFLAATIKEFQGMSDSRIIEHLVAAEALPKGWILRQTRKGAWVLEDTSRAPQRASLDEMLASIGLKPAKAKAKS